MAKEHDSTKIGSGPEAIFQLDYDYCLGLCGKHREVTFEKDQILVSFLGKPFQPLGVDQGFGIESVENRIPTFSEPEEVGTVNKFMV